MRVLSHLALGAALALAITGLRRLGHGPDRVPKLTQWWHRRLCDTLGMRIEVSGHWRPPCLLVANHVSWLDVPLIGAQGEMRFLSKSEVGAWPLVGLLARVAGTLFIARGAHHWDEVARTMRQRLSEGHTLVLFPEGTTTDGTRLGRFHPRLFAAAEAGAPVASGAAARTPNQGRGARIQPLAISYHRGSETEPDPSIAYVGDDHLLANLLRVIRHPRLVARIQFLEPLESSDEADRRTRCEQARRAIAEALYPDPWETEMPFGERRHAA